MATTVRITADTSACGTLISRSMSFATAASGLGTMEVRSNPQWYWAGQTFSTTPGVGYEVFGFLMVFDTSVLPTNAIVTDAKLEIRINQVTLTRAAGWSTDSLTAWFKISNWTEPLDATDWHGPSGQPVLCSTYQFTYGGQIDQWLTIPLNTSTYSDINLGAGARTGVVAGYTVADLVFGIQDVPNYMRFAHWPDVGVEAVLVVTYTLTYIDPAALILELFVEGRCEALVNYSTVNDKYLTPALSITGALFVTAASVPGYVHIMPAMRAEGALFASVYENVATTLNLSLFIEGNLDAAVYPGIPGDQEASGTLDCCASGLLFLDTVSAYDRIAIGLVGVGTLTVGDFQESIPLWDGTLTLQGVGTLAINAAVEGYEVISASMLLEVSATGGFPV